MTAGKTVTFGIRVQAESNAGEAANSVEALRQRIAASQEAVKSYQATLRQLRGTTDEVKAAKEKLKGATEAEKNSISANALALGKLGTTYAQVVREQQKAAQSTESMKEKTRALRDALRVGGDETRRLSAAFDFMDRFAANSTIALVSLGAASIFLAGAMGVGLVAAVTAGAVALGKFAIESGNVLRQQSLDREAATGTVENARNFGTAIENLRQRIPATREELNKLAIEQYRLYDATKISGQGILDAWKAVATIRTAQGPEGNKIADRISDVLSRNKQQGRFGLQFGQGIGGGYDELQGTGLKSIDVAKQLAKNLNISLGAAEQALYLHRVKLDDGARAIKEAIEARFGAVNVKRFYDLDNIVKRLHDNLQGLFKDFGVEKVLEDVDKLAQNFDVAYANGYGLKALLDGFGELLGFGVDKATNSLQNFTDHAINYMLKLEVKALDVRDKLREWQVTVNDVWIAIKEIPGAVASTIPGLNTVLLVLKAAAAEASIISGAFHAVTGGGGSAKTRDITSFSRGEGGPLNAPVFGDETSPELRAAYAHGRALGLGVQEGYKDEQEIHSPSKVFERLGEQEAEGRALGWEKTGLSAPMPKLSIPPSGGGTASQIDSRVSVTISLPNVKDAESFLSEIAHPDALAMVTKVFEDMVRGNGGLTQTPAAQGGV